MGKIIALIKASALIETLLKSAACFFYVLLVLLAVNPGLSHAADYNISSRTKIYTVQTPGDSVLLKMDNSLSVPVSVKLTLKLDNLEGKDTTSVIAVVPARVTGHTVAGFKRKVLYYPYRCAYNWKIVIGDVTRTPDKDFIYGLPYPKDVSYKVSQGPGGSYSHKDLFAYDFVMPVGTPVIAARNGIVALIKADSFTGGPDKAYENDGNFISVYNEDGSIANYFHLNTGGALVEEGQHVKKGDLIGYSGNTGFSNGPHLHFELLQPDLDNMKKSIEFTFETRTGNYLADIL